MAILLPAKLGDLITGSLNGKILKDDANFDVEYQKKKHHVEAVITPKDKSMADMFEKVIMSFSEDKMTICKTSGIWRRLYAN